MTIVVDMRLAERTDRAALRTLQATSFRALGPAAYDEDVIEAFIAHVGTMDDTLIDDGSYFVAFVDGTLVGCGGWSSRTPGCVAQRPGGIALPQARANVCSVYVHPALTRQGIARCLMARIETDMRAAGYDQAWLGATLVGFPFFRRFGYRNGEPVVLRMPGELLLVGLNMHKRLDAAEAFAWPMNAEVPLRDLPRVRSRRRVGPSVVPA